MAFWQDFKDVPDMFSKMWEVNKKSQKNVSTLTQDPSAAMSGSLEILGGITEAEKTKIQAEKQAKMDKENYFQGTSALAKAAYASGGSNMQSFTNRSQNKKSILGSF